MRQEKAILYAIDADRASRIDVIRWATGVGLEARPFMSGADFIDALPHLKAGIVVVNLTETGMKGISLVSAVADACPQCPVIAILPAPDMDLAVTCLQHGAADVVVKITLPESLHEAVFKVRRVGKARQSLFEQADRDATALSRLSARERDVLTAIAAGATSKTAADQLGLSVRTIEAYRNSLVAKLQSGTTAGAVAIAMRHDAFLRTRAAYGAKGGDQRASYL